MSGCALGRLETNPGISSPPHLILCNNFNIHEYMITSLGKSSNRNYKSLLEWTVTLVSILLSILIPLSIPNCISINAGGARDMLYCIFTFNCSHQLCGDQIWIQCTNQNLSGWRWWQRLWSMIINWDNNFFPKAIINTFLILMIIITDDDNFNIH